MAVALNSPRPHDGARGHPAFTTYHYDLAHEVRAATVACRQRIMLPDLVVPAGIEPATFRV